MMGEGKAPRESTKTNLTDDSLIVAADCRERWFDESESLSSETVKTLNFPLPPPVNIHIKKEILFLSIFISYKAHTVSLTKYLPPFKYV